MWDAKIFVKVAGICCVITIGTLGDFNADIKVNSACGPPVDEPIARTLGGIVDRLALETSFTSLVVPNFTGLVAETGDVAGAA